MTADVDSSYDSVAATDLAVGTTNTFTDTTMTIAVADDDLTPTPVATTAEDPTVYVFFIVNVCDREGFAIAFATSFCQPLFFLSQSHRITIFII